ncbi:MAG TPA: nucleoside phosphorylase [Microbacterium sp.]|nr:nucleoside phosphorylase [Microbacterium sp.]
MRLLVAALDAELVAFPAQIDGFDRLVTGPGKLPAAVGLTRVLAARSYTEIVVVGTAGAVDPAVEADVHEIGAVLQHDVSDLDGVVGQHVSLPARIALADEGHTIATGDIFVDDADAVVRINALGAALVDMESYAYAYVAGEFGVPLRIIKAVSDRAQDGASQLWDEVVATCSAALWSRFRADYAL